MIVARPSFGMMATWTATTTSSARVTKSPIGGWVIPFTWAAGHLKSTGNDDQNAIWNAAIGDDKAIA